MIEDLGNYQRLLKGLYNIYKLIGWGKEIVEILEQLFGNYLNTLYYDELKDLKRKFRI